MNKPIRDFAGRAHQLTRPFEGVIAMIPSDDAGDDLPRAVRGFETTASGSVAVVMADGTEAVLTCTAGVSKPFSIVRVKSTGTSAEITSVIGCI